MWRYANTPFQCDEGSVRSEVDVADGAVVRCAVRLREVVGKILNSGGPGDFEDALALLGVEPVVAHVDGLGALGDFLAGDDAHGGFVVEDEGGCTLGVAEVGEGEAG
eukprot:CAMPEP_0184712912 /NCGR_PEP_ID=MMETSP0314-20130426/3374_1 /TAXON_ID=38298 /ORGANISM="Rhodella maculata, Strain CCMP 736" /LENGTH=106 /DNA_ID=CAMNT_0027175443 /DNA_START=130 /DNA_END=446 /DNA_ORIENTATION=-